MQSKLDINFQVLERLKSIIKNSLITQAGQTDLIKRKNAMMQILH
jgi:hypothetical protein